MNADQKAKIKATLQRVEQLRLPILFYGPNLDLKKFEILVRTSMKGPLEVLDGHTPVSQTAFDELVSRLGPGSLLVVTEERDNKLLNTTLRGALLRLLRKKNRPTVLLAASVAAPMRLDRGLTATCVRSPL